MSYRTPSEVLASKIYLGDKSLFEMTKVVCVRPFYVDRKIVNAGETVEVTNELARGLVANNKAKWPKK